MTRAATLSTTNALGLHVTVEVKSSFVVVLQIRDVCPACVVVMFVVQRAGVIFIFDVGYVMRLVQFESVIVVGVGFVVRGGTDRPLVVCVVGCVVCCVGIGSVEVRGRHGSLGRRAHGSNRATTKTNTSGWL